MVKDPVCGMQVDETKAPVTAAYEGKPFYFCAVGCKDKFVKEPKKYAAGGASSDCCKTDKGASSSCCK